VADDDVERRGAASGRVDAGDAGDLGPGAAAVELRGERRAVGRQGDHVPGTMGRLEHDEGDVRIGATVEAGATGAGVAKADLDRVAGAREGPIDEPRGGTEGVGRPGDDVARRVSG